MTTDLRLGNTQEVQRDEALVSSEHRELGLLAPRQQAVLSIRARVDECDAATFVHDSLETIHTYLVEHHIHPDGPPFVLRTKLHRDLEMVLYLDLFSALGGTRIPNLLIRR
jgi:hypothetical protein